MPTVETPFGSKYNIVCIEPELFPVRTRMFFIWHDMHITFPRFSQSHYYTEVHTSGTLLMS